MNTATLLSFFLAALSGSMAVPKQCTDNAECASTECCQILSEFMIVSKRDLASTAPKLVRGGTCQPYKYEGDNCDVFAKVNGYCSCAPGLECKGEEVYIGTPSPLPTLTLFNQSPVKTRSMLPPRPGFQWEYKCRKI